MKNWFKWFIITIVLFSGIIKEWYRKYEIEILLTFYITALTYGLIELFLIPHEKTTVLLDITGFFCIFFSLMFLGIELNNICEKCWQSGRLKLRGMAVINLISVMGMIIFMVIAVLSWKREIKNIYIFIPCVGLYLMSCMVFFQSMRLSYQKFETFKKRNEELMQAPN